MSLAQTEWVYFVDRVERGEVVDYSGQYVAKGTKAGLDATGQRGMRPKFDAATLDFGKHYARLTNKQTAGTTTGGVLSIICNNEDCIGGSGGVGVPPVTSTFRSSISQGGSGQIRDLKLVGLSNSTSRAAALNSGYTLLDADLNKGAGGAYIYLCFVRNAANVLSGLEYYQGQTNSSPNDVLTSFTTKNGSTTVKPRADSRYFDIWVPNQNPYPYWAYMDLNAGAGGAYIYSFQSKSNQIPTFNGYFSEVGILSGNSASIQPPAGWIKYPADLNEGAGGDFIYFCSKY